jgi:hypothetical protein
MGAMIYRVLMVASAAIVFTFGTIHLVYTFWGTKLTPRDSALQAKMKEVSPVITRTTTMWKTWVGFNATHSMGLMLFGILYAYFAVRQPNVLFGSPFVLVVGLAALVGYFFVAKAYFFRTPFLAICVALLFYVASWVASVALAKPA